MEFPRPIEIKKEKEILEYDIINIFDDNFNIEVKVEGDENVIEENDWCIENVIKNETNYRYSVIDFDYLTDDCVQRCLQCSMIFTNCYQLLQHNMTHLNVYLHKASYFQCSVCSEIFLLKFKLIQHIKSKHNNLKQKRKPIRKTKKNYMCTICQKVFSYGTWHGHLREVHCERKYRCEICGYAFKAPRYLKRHILKIHEKTLPVTKTKPEPKDPVNCIVCGTVSQSKIALKMHMKNCHSEQSYYCDLCCYRNEFKSLPYLRTHLRRQHKFIANDYVCNVCKKSFKWLQLLKIHSIEACK